MGVVKCKVVFSVYTVLAQTVWNFKQYRVVQKLAWAGKIHVKF